MEHRRLKRVRRTDRIATGVITVGGIGIILSVILILVLIFKEALPLFQKPLSEILSISKTESPDRLLFVFPGNYREQILSITESGKLRTYDLESERARLEKDLPRPPQASRLLSVTPAGPSRFSGIWNTGNAILYEMKLATSYDSEGVRSLDYTANVLAEFKPANTNVAPSALPEVLRMDPDGGSTRARLTGDNTIHIEKTVREENFLGEETISTETYSITPEKELQDITALTMDDDGSKLYIGTADGRLGGWKLKSNKAQIIDHVKIGPEAPVTALSFILGNESIAVGSGDGSLSVWSLIRHQGMGSAVTKLHTLRRHQSSVNYILPSRRNRSVLSMDTEGIVQLSHVTSERLLYRFQDYAGTRLASLSEKGDSLALLDKDGYINLFKLDAPHPETSVKTLFGKVWYESYYEPKHVWQSSSASDDFEPKLSLIPLIFGSIKGTLYAMLFSIPLALFGALYTSQFTTYRIRGFVKPMVEIMAAIPSVVVGFLAALWFAPLLERNLTGFFLSLGLVPAMILMMVFAWQFLRTRKSLEWVENGYEFTLLIPCIIIGVVLAGVFGTSLEQHVFGGNLKLWLYQSADIIYDPRNCIIIAFALGFAVIPIIFTIAEDAFSNVPKGLRAASLALGASRWQTVWRVILPSASPGIFAAIIIGLGRAVGETMIVLMATGNTPIIDLSAFNGMRTLSANIAVEIPEAPHGGTLYRVLFLSAVILFMMTFVLNTGAEIVRDKLRKRYGQFQ